MVFLRQLTYAAWIALSFFICTAGCSVDPLDSSQTEYYVPEDFEFAEGEEAGVNSGSGNIIGVEKIDFRFLNEGDKAVELGDKVELSVLTEVADPTATWSLFYTSDVETLSGTVAILKDQPTSQTSTKWDTSFVGPGVYQVAALVETQGKAFLFRSKQKITVTGDFIAAKEEAKLGFTSPLVNGIYQATSPINVKFEVLDDPQKYVSYNIEFSLDGQNYQVLQEAVQPSTDISWTLPDALTASAKLRIAAKMASGHTSYVAQDDFFGISNEGDITTDTIKSIVDASCASCHSGNNASGGIRLDSNQRIESFKEGVYRTTRPDAAIPMPEGGLPAKEQTIIGLWYLDNK